MVDEIKVEHVLILAIVVFLLYHFIGRCGCNNGFSVGGEDWTSGDAGLRQYTHKDFEEYAYRRKLVDCSPLSYEDLINLTPEELDSNLYTFRCNKDIQRKYRNDGVFIDKFKEVRALSQQCALFGWSPTHRSYYRTDCANPSHYPRTSNNLEGNYVLLSGEEELKPEMAYTNKHTNYENRGSSEGDTDLPRYYPLGDRLDLYKDNKVWKKARHALPTWTRYNTKRVAAAGVIADRK